MYASISRLLRSSARLCTITAAASSGAAASAPPSRLWMAVIVASNAR
jgi:hypothetical protein